MAGVDSTGGWLTTAGAILAGVSVMWLIMNHNRKEPAQELVHDLKAKQVTQERGMQMPAAMANTVIGMMSSLAIDQGRVAELQDDIKRDLLTKYSEDLKRLIVLLHKADDSQLSKDRELFLYAARIQAMMMLYRFDIPSKVSFDTMLETNYDLHTLPPTWLTRSMSYQNQLKAVEGFYKYNAELSSNNIFDISGNDVDISDWRRVAPSDVVDPFPYALGMRVNLS